MLAWQGLNRRSALSSGNGSAVCDAQADPPVLTGSRSRPWKRWVRPCGPQKPMRECLGLASRLLTDSISLFHVVTCSGVLETAQVFSPVPRPAASSHISAGGLQTASGRPAGLANTSQKDLAVLEHGMI
ncbi:TPA: hypothetical protein ACH3X2_000313 [Trebouxia sp. C0005]